MTRENIGPISGTFVLENVSDVATSSGDVLQMTSVARGLTEFAKPEDGAWHTLDSRVFDFVVTGSSIDGAGQSARLDKLTFDSLVNPTGGTIELVVDRASLTPSQPSFQQFDNMTVAGDGSEPGEEDPGARPIWQNRGSSFGTIGAASEILQSDPERFASPPLPLFNVDEESSGIIDVTDIVRSAHWDEQGRRYFLADLQAHYPIPAELVEGGQLHLIASPKR